MKLHIDSLAKPRFERKRRSGIMLCYPFEEKRLARWGGCPVFVQPKLDGERARLKWDARDGWNFYSSTEEVLDFSVPHLLEAINRSGLPTSTHLDGELYAHGLSFQDIHSIVSRRVDLHPDHTAINYYVFDLCEPDAPQWTRFLRLRQLEPAILRAGFAPVPVRVADSPDQIWSIMESYVAEGYEGIIIRHQRGLWKPKRSTEIMKFKPKQSDTYRIVGVVQLKDQFGTLHPELGAFICEADGEVFSVGTGFSQAQRQIFWTEYLASPELFTSGELFAKISYQHITEGGTKRSKGVPRFPVFVTLAEEGEQEDE